MEHLIVYFVLCGRLKLVIVDNYFHNEFHVQLLVILCGILVSQYIV